MRGIDDENESGYMPDHLPTRGSPRKVISHVRERWPLYLIGVIILAVILR